MSVIATAGDKFMSFVDRFRPCKTLIQVAEESKDASIDTMNSVKELTETLKTYMEKTNPPKLGDEE